MSNLKDFTIQRPSGLMTISSEAERENLTGYNLGSDLKSCQNNNLRNSRQRDGHEKIKKSVSFEEDVIVYLFDQVLVSCSLFFNVKTLRFKRYRFIYFILISVVLMGCVANVDNILVCFYLPTVCCWFLGEPHLEAAP